VVFRYSGGIPRLVNLLCDTALVYGYAEQAPRIGAQLIEDVARDKQQSRILPLRQQTPAIVDKAHDPAPGQPAGKKGRAVSGGSGRKLRVAIAADSERQRNYLKMMLERSGLQVVVAVAVDEDLIEQLDRENVDVLLMDLDEGAARRPYDLDRLIDQVQSKCKIPVLFNDSSSAGAGGAISDLGRKLSLKLTSLIGRG
jgi:predicted outer membrane repeat protein